MTATYMSIASVPTSESFNPANLVIRPEPWMRDASCAETGGDDHFADGKGKQYTNAKKVCAGCDVVNECLVYALRNREDIGIWGGTTPEERKKMRKAAKR